MISFEMPAEIRERVDLVRGVARELMRPAAREFDEREHEIPWDFVNAMWDLSLKTGQSLRSGTRRGDGGVAAQALVHVIETLSWGDAGIYLCGPGAGLGGAAIEVDVVLAAVEGDEGQHGERNGRRRAGISTGEIHGHRDHRRE